MWIRSIGVARLDSEEVEMNMSQGVVEGESIRYPQPDEGFRFKV